MIQEKDKIFKKGVNSYILKLTKSWVKVLEFWIVAKVKNKRNSSSTVLDFIKKTSTIPVE